MFQKESLRKNIKNNDEKNDDKIKDEKLQHDINREAAKISDLSSCKMDKYEYLTGEEILPWGHSKSMFAQDSRVLIPPCSSFFVFEHPSPQERSFWVELTSPPEKLIMKTSIFR